MCGCRDKCQCGDLPKINDSFSLLSCRWGWTDFGKRSKRKIINLSPTLCHQYLCQHSHLYWKWETQGFRENLTVEIWSNILSFGSVQVLCQQNWGHSLLTMLMQGGVGDPKGEQCWRESNLATEIHFWHTNMRIIKSFWGFCCLWNVASLAIKFCKHSMLICTSLFQMLFLFYYLRKWAIFIKTFLIEFLQIYLNMILQN